MTCGRARRIVAAATVGAALVLAGCASTRTSPPSGGGESLSGRLSVRVEATTTTPSQSVSGSFELLGTPEAGQLNLLSPLGTQVAQARWSGTRATLKTSDGETAYDDLGQLSRDMLGETLPVAALFDWLRGRPWSGAPSQPRADGLAGFEQMGWTIDLGRQKEGWVNAHRAAPPAVTVRARIDPT